MCSRCRLPSAAATAQADVSSLPLQEHPIRVCRAPQRPHLQLARIAGPSSAADEATGLMPPSSLLLSAQRRQMDIWQLGQSVHPSIQVGLSLHLLHPVSALPCLLHHALPERYYGIWKKHCSSTAKACTSTLHYLLVRGALILSGLSASKLFDMEGSSW